MMRYKLLFFLIATMLSAEMNASNGNDFTPISNVFADKIGKENARLIFEADSIVAHLTIWETDSLPCKVLTPSDCSIVKYTLCQPVMFSTDKRIYSSFYADVRLVIYNGSSSLTLELDYNINKWRLMDEKGKQLCRYDLRYTELLSLFRMLWPESKNIKIKYEKFSD